MEKYVPTNAEAFKQASLDLLAGQLAMYGAYPGYKTARLWVEGGLVRSPPDGHAMMPVGYDALPGGELPSERQIQAFLAAGLEVDYPYGKPLHPWVEDMVSRRDIGLVTGKGKYYHWGPNYTADPIVFRRTEASTEILLIQRGDTGMWALPGGFVEPGDTNLETAIKEAGQETNIDISVAAATAQLVYQGPLADLRVTANAWPETAAYLFDMTNIDLPSPLAGDDAVDARWTPLEQCSDILFGSHSLLVGMAGALYDAQS